MRTELAVPESVKLEFQATVKPLEDVPKNEKDRHPGSYEKVLDLVYPSLFLNLLITDRRCWRDDRQHSRTSSRCFTKNADFSEGSQKS